MSNAGSLVLPPLTCNDLNYWVVLSLPFFQLQDQRRLGPSRMLRRVGLNWDV